MERRAILDEIMHVFMNHPGHFGQHEESGEWSSVSLDAVVRQTKQAREDPQQGGAGQSSVKPAPLYGHQRDKSPSVPILEEYPQRREAGPSSVKPASFHERQRDDSLSVSILEEHPQRREAGQSGEETACFYEHQRDDSPSVSIFEDRPQRREAGHWSVETASFRERQCGSPSVLEDDDHNDMPPVAQDSTVLAPPDIVSPPSSAIPPAHLWDFDALLKPHFQEWLASFSRGEPACCLVSDDSHSRERVTSATDVSP
jgi:hypothetical protein